MTTKRRSAGGQGVSDATTRSLASTHLDELTTAVGGFGDCAEAAATLGARLARVLAGGGRLLAAGNGGSAAQAQHLTAELVGRYREDRRPFSAICLSSETSSLTAIGNDYPATELFARQVEAHGRPGDVLIVLSTSGRSPNIVEAARRGREHGLEVWAFTGPAPNPTADVADWVLAVDAESTATVQELHLVALHLVCEALDASLDVVTPGSTATVESEPDQSRAAAGAGKESTPRRSAAWPAGSADRPESAPAGPARICPTGRRIVVVGDSLLDVDVTGRACRLSPDAPVPVLDELVERPRPGGAALAAALAARDGHDVTLITALDDEAGRVVERLLLDVHGVRLVKVPFAGRTATKRRVRSGGQSLLRLDSGGTGGEYGPVPAGAAEAIERAGVVLVSDYGRGLSGHRQLREALAARPRRVPLVWDPHPKGSAPVKGAQVVTPNETEADGWAAGLVDRSPGAHSTRLARARADAEALVREWSVQAVAVTLGDTGALLSYGEGAPVVTPAPPVTCLDACGAGDRFAVKVAEGLAAGLVVTEAVQFAVESAADFVAAGGAAAVCSDPGDRGHADLDGSAEASADGSETSVVNGSRPPAGDGSRRSAVGGSALSAHSAADGRQNPVGSAATAVHRAVSLATRARAQGATVVATGGCFDLLHAGHVATLQAARRLGDHLIVLLNSDESVRRLKGPGRPLVPAADRVRVLEALEFVDAVLVFDEDTPTEALTRLKPHVWAKGGDYAGRTLPEAAALEQWGGQAVALPYLGGRSTTDLVRIAARSASLDGPGPARGPVGVTAEADPSPYSKDGAATAAQVPEQRITGQERHT